VIELNDVTKKYIVHKDKRVTLKEKVLFGFRSAKEEYVALDGVSINIEPGLTVGIVGRNGSGKSTMLKLISRIIYPTSGSVKVRGKVSSLLELGAGFHPDFTGRENIYMNASILGFSKKEIDRMLDKIIEFSELEAFIDNPLRSYSSGMYMRLAFSVAISVDPDILLIDEILAVGDVSFQKKCINRLKELKRNKKTIVIVSHDNLTLEQLCDQIIWLKDGKVHKTGPAKEVINDYIDFMSKAEGRKHDLKQRVQQNADASEKQGQAQKPEPENPKPGNRWGNEKIKIVDVRICGRDMAERYSFNSGESVIFKIAYEMVEKTEDVVFGFRITTHDGINCYGSNTYLDQVSFGELPMSGTVCCKIDRLDLVEGNYLLDFAIVQMDGTAYDYYCGGYSIQVMSKTRDTGIAKLPHAWFVEKNGT
jgi:ABC-type polysaccharide/polyol phosphate transport system ATPase subunit